jgi:hypothetical protein
MRYVSLLLVVALLLLSVITAQACWRPMVRGFDGDPDEFQAANVHSDTQGSSRPESRHVRLDQPESREPSEPRLLPEVREQRRFSFSFSGREFFLEK